MPTVRATYSDILEEIDDRKEKNRVHKLWRKNRDSFCSKCSTYNVNIDSARRLANVRCVLKEVVAGTDSDWRLSA
jgi:hypothetical protein